MRQEKQDKRKLTAWEQMLMRGLARASSATLTPAQREAALRQVAERLTARPQQFDCEPCEDTGMIVSIDDEGIAGSRDCACKARRIREHRPPEPVVDFGEARKEDDEFDFRPLGSVARDGGAA